MIKQWGALFSSNFLGVFNDNLLKNAIIFIAVSWQLPSWLTQSQLIALVSASLVIPFLVLSPYGGKLAVRYSKLAVFRFFKLIETPIMLLAVIAFMFEWILIAVIAVFLMGIQSSLYSPAKYGLIRDVGGREGSAFGSGVFETMGFLGILIGTVTASWISDHYSKWMLSVLYIILALAGYGATRLIRVNELPSDKVSSAALHFSPWSFLLESYKTARQFAALNTSVIGVSLFWMIGAMIQMNIVIHAGNVYSASNTSTGIVMAFAAIGIAVGSWIAGILASRIRIQLLILTGISGMLISLLMILVLQLDFNFFMALIFFVAFFGGFFQVPNLTRIQQADTGQLSGQIMAYMNLMIFVFVLFGTALFSLTTYFTNENSYAVFAVIALVCVLSLFIIFARPLKRKGSRVPIN